LRSGTVVVEWWSEAGCDRVGRRLAGWRGYRGALRAEQPVWVRVWVWGEPTIRHTPTGRLGGGGCALAAPSGLGGLGG
jgi:hypothetical protein